MPTESLPNSETLSDADIWQNWLEWLPNAPPVERPLSMFAHYRLALLESGSSEADATARMAVIVQKMRTETDGWSVLFDNIYANPNPGFKTLPNALLVSAVSGRRAGRALDVSTGQGRNAVFLALQGWEVTASDISEGGLQVAAQNAAQAGVSISTLLQSNGSLTYGQEVWDLIVLTYVPVPVTSPEYVAKLRESLRPGGLVVVESFASDRQSPARRPVDIDPADLKSAFSEFSLLHVEDVTAMPDWETEETRIVRLIAEKPLETRL